MGDKLIMSAKERKRKVICEDIKRGYLSVTNAAQRMGVGYRQAKRIWKKYRENGDIGLVHKSRGKASGHAYAIDFKQKILKLYEDKYLDFGPTFAAEKMTEEDKVVMNDETLRLWLLEAKLWQPRRKRKSYRQRRARREKFGELLQIDGSDHAWFGSEYPRCCLLNIVDDATGITMSQLDYGETCKVLLGTLKSWVKKYGVPKAVYVDLKNLYVSPRREVDDDVETTMNVFERVCQLLDIQIIKAYSPQAKGRVERNHGVYQDRFVKELKLKKITTIEEANDFLWKTYLNKVNRKFAKKPASEEDAHCSHKAYGDLNQIFCWEYNRKIRNDYTIRFDNEFYQLRKYQPIKLRESQDVEIHVHLNGNMSFWKNDYRLAYKKIKEPEPKEPEAKKESDYTSAERSAIARSNKHKSPWNQYNPKWIKNRKRPDERQLIKT
jgi:molybdenum-dependent DNA-binding transcriptional regulator ModE